MTKPANLVPYYTRLTPKERACLLWMLKTEYAVLPFTNIHKVVETLNYHANHGDQYRRVAKEILVKLAEAIPNYNTSFLMHLNPVKVAKHFGKRPDLGKALPHLQKEKVTVGVKWSLPKKRYEPDRDVLVTPCVTLKELGPGAYSVNVLSRCRQAVELWLMDNCQ